MKELRSYEADGQRVLNHIQTLKIRKSYDEDTRDILLPEIGAMQGILENKIRKDDNVKATAGDFFKSLSIIGAYVKRGPELFVGRTRHSVKARLKKCYNDFLVLADKFEDKDVLEQLWSHFVQFVELLK